MFFAVSKLIKWMVFPLSWLCLALAIVWWGFRRRWARPMLGIVVAVLYLLSLSALSDAALRSWEVPEVQAVSLRQHYEAVVVLAGVIHLTISTPERIEFHDGVDRMLAGIQLVKSGRANRLVISGGSGSLFNPHINEAKLLKVFAHTWGLAEHQVSIEGVSRNTHESAVEVAAMFDGPEQQPIVLVTSAFHMRRAAACFRKEGLVFDTYPVDYRAGRTVNPLLFVPSVGSLQRFSTLMNELVGMAIYRMRGYV